MPEEEYLIFDDDYEKFFGEARYNDATTRLKNACLFDAVETITKMKLPKGVVYKEHVPQKYLRDGSLNPQIELKRIFTVSVGNDEQDEIVKFCRDAQGVIMYGPWQKRDELIVDDAKATEFLHMAHNSV